MVKSAVLSDIVAPSGPLSAGSVGHVTGNATNTGTESLTLYADLMDYDTGGLVFRQGPMNTTIYSPIRSLDLTFTMPNRNFRWYISLHD